MTRNLIMIALPRAAAFVCIVFFVVFIKLLLDQRPQWVTYHDASSLYTVSYPPNWSLVQRSTEDDTPAIAVFEAPETSVRDFEVISGAVLDVAYATDGFPPSAREWYGYGPFSPPRIIDEKKRAVAGRPALVFEAEGGHRVGRWQGALISAPRGVLEIELASSGEFDPAFFERVVASISFPE